MSSKNKQTKKKRQSNLWYDFIKVTGAIPVLCWMRPKILYAGEKKRIKGGFLIAANHISFVDPIVIHCAFASRRLNCVATKDLFDTKMKNFFFKRMHCILVDKDNFNMRTFHTVCERLNENKVVVVFPEGTVNSNHDDTILTFKSGSILMAYKAQKPIVPVYMATIQKWWQRRVVVIGDPIEVNPTGGMMPSLAEVRKINERLHDKEEELIRYYKNYKEKTRRK